MRKILLNAILAFAMPVLAATDYSSGVFIINEDWYGHQNSTVNYLQPDDPNGEYWHYRVIQTENPGMELGCTNQFGAIWNGRFYFIAKQDKDPGASVVGGRITVADAATMKILYQSALIDPSGEQCDGRGFVGVDEHKGYVSTSNGVWIFNLDTYAVEGMIEGTAGDMARSLYFGQAGSMVLAGTRVFLAHQQAGIVVIDTLTDSVTDIISMDIVKEKAGVGSVVLAKDGSVWASVASDTSGSGLSLPYLLRIDPASLSTEVVTLAESILPPSNSWYAWTPDTFCASEKNNALYWTGGANSWFSGFKIFSFDVDRREATMIVDLEADGGKWKIYGCSMRVHPVTDEIYTSLYHEFSIPTYITRRYTADGTAIRDYNMSENYWFPSLPVFPQSDSSAAISNVAVSDNISIRICADASFHISNAANMAVEIYNMEGNCVCGSIADSDNFMLHTGLSHGIYLLRVGKQTMKFRI